MEIVSVTIPSGQSESSVIDLTDKVILGVFTPSGWTSPATVFCKLVVSYDGVNFKSMFHGVDFSTPDLYYVFDADDVARLSGLKYIKLLSVARPSGLPASQDDDREFNLVTRKYGCTINVSCG